MTTITTIKLLAENLGVDETFRGECPSCGRRNTFTVTRTNGGVVWNCYSAHCALHGAVGGVRHTGTSDGVDSRSLGQSRRPVLWDQKIEKITEDMVEFLGSRVGFTPKHLAISRVGWNETSKRCVFPILGAKQERRGYVLRSFQGAIPKTLTILDEGQSLSASWYGERDLAVVVEDIPSAVRVAPYFRSIALNGVHVPSELVAEMLDNGIQTVIWALDGDALHESCRHHKWYGPLFRESRIMVLQKDFKDQTESELTETLRL